MDLNHFGIFEELEPSGKNNERFIAKQCCMGLKNHKDKYITMVYLPKGSMDILHRTEDDIIDIVNFANRFCPSVGQYLGIESQKWGHAMYLPYNISKDYYVVKIQQKTKWGAYLPFLVLRPLYSSVNYGLADSILEMVRSEKFQKCSWEEILALALVIERPFPLTGKIVRHYEYYGFVQVGRLMKKKVKLITEGMGSGVNLSFTGSQTITQANIDKVSKLFLAKEYDEVKDLFYKKLWK